MKKKTSIRNFILAESNTQSIQYNPIIPRSIYGKIIILFLLILFMLVNSYKLTNASLWFDEGVEYLISIMPFSKMIPAIKDTFQPPLYNFVMHFLFKISTSEYFFRFTGVIFGLFGCFGLYCSINEICNWKVAGISVFCYTFLRSIVYYNQECAEYSLLIANLFWTIYFFVCLIKGYSHNKAIGFSVFCVLSIYSQYGALFPLAAMSISIVLFYALDKQWKNLKSLIISMGSAMILFGVPLYFGFLKFQRESQGTTNIKSFDSLFVELINFINGIKTNFSVSFPTFYEHKFLTILVELIYIIAFGILIYGVIQRKNRQYKFIAISGLLSYLLYSVAVQIGVYGYGNYGSRYVLPIVPTVFVSLFVVAYLVISSIKKSLIKINSIYSHVYSIILIFTLTLNNLNNWQTIKHNWGKEDVRSTLNMWVEETNGDDEIYVYYAAVPTFAFYSENYGLDYGKSTVENWGPFGANIDPTITQYKNFHYGENNRGKDIDYVKNSINQSFSNNMPDDFWFILSHINLDNQVYMDTLAEMGYSYEVYKWDGARLLWFYNSNYINNNYKTLIDENVSFEQLVTNTEQMTYVMENNSYIINGENPTFFITTPNITTNTNQKHKIVIDFTSTHAGSIKIFYNITNSNTDPNENSVESPYVIGKNKLTIELPENANLDSLRLNYNILDLKEDEESSVIVAYFNVLEDL